MIEILLQSYKAIAIKYAPYALVVVLLGLAYFTLRYIRDEQQVPTVRVIGYNPVNRFVEMREVELEGDTAVWYVEEGDNIRFKPVAETRHDTPEGPAWMVDLTDGRTMAVNDSDQTVRTTGQELHKAVKDNTIAQSLSTADEDIALYIKLLVIAAPIIILGLVVIGLGVFLG